MSEHVCTLTMFKQKLVLTDLSKTRIFDTYSEGEMFWDANCTSQYITTLPFSHHSSIPWDVSQNTFLGQLKLTVLRLILSWYVNDERMLRGV